MTNLDHAVNALNKLLNLGWEWPDASAKIAVEYSISQEDLSNAYDSYAEGNQLTDNEYSQYMTLR